MSFQHEDFELKLLKPLPPDEPLSGTLAALILPIISAAAYSCLAVRPPLANFRSSAPLGGETADVPEILRRS